MKPIEIHIEGYKIVISKEDDNDGGDNEKGNITYVPKKDDDKDDLTLPYSTPPITPNVPYVPPNPDWWRYPYVTWSRDDVFNIDSTAGKSTIVRDFMVGKRTEQK